MSTSCRDLDIMATNSWNDPNGKREGRQHRGIRAKAEREDRKEREERAAPRNQLYPCGRRRPSSGCGQSGEKASEKEERGGERLTSLTISNTSSLVGFWPRLFMTVPSSTALMVPSPSVSQTQKKMVSEGTKRVDVLLPLNSNADSLREEGETKRTNLCRTEKRLLSALRTQDSENGERRR